MERFGKWSTTGNSVGRKTPCVCDCGTERIVNTYDLRAGKSTNCGCVRKLTMPAAASNANKKHGRSDMTEQWIWSDMKRRCYNPNRRGYSNYGGRGITVCDRWLYGSGNLSGFACFLADMGARPSNEFTLDRIDNELNYTPENCRWASIAEQSYNKRDTYKFNAFGETFTLKSAEERFGINKDTLYQRLHTHKMDPEIALTKPLKRR